MIISPSGITTSDSGITILLSGRSIPHSRMTLLPSKRDSRDCALRGLPCRFQMAHTPFRLAGNWPYDTGMNPADAYATLIRDAFAGYHARFASITRRAKLRFETMDWASARADAVERIELYDLCIAECMEALQDALGERAHDRELWSAIRDGYERLIAEQIDRELYKTFYNTLTRRFFKTRGVDASVEFVALDIEPTDAITHPVARHSYAVSELRPTDTFVRVLGDYRFNVPYAHRTRCAAAIAVRLQDDLGHWGDENPVRSVELLDTVFYRERRAYLIGRVFGEHRFSPFVIALVNDRGRPARGCGAHPSRRRGAPLQLFAQLFPRRPGHRGRCGGVPAHAAAGQAHRRDLHRAGPRQAGQDRTLPHLLPPFRRAEAGAPDPSRRRARHGHGGVHPAQLRAGVQGDPRPFRLSEGNEPRPGGSQVFAGVPPRPRRPIGGCAALSFPAISARPLRTGSAGGTSADLRQRPDRGRRRHRGAPVLRGDGACAR